MNHEKANEVIKELFESRLNRYQYDVETSMRGSDFIFDWVTLLHSQYHKISFKWGRSYLYSPQRIENKKSNN